MAISLQEQLLKAGLTSKEKAKKARQEKHKKAKAKQKHKTEELTDAQISVNEAREAKKQKDAELALKQKQEREEKEIVAQVIDLIQSNKQSRGAGDVKLNFTDGTIVKHMYVGTSVHKQVTQGRLAIVLLENDIYELVPSPVATKIAQRLPECIVYQADEDNEERAASEEDDWYADYEIPDDLMW